MATLLKNMSLWNMVLMVVSLLLAVYLPFELFLIAYAILGPLHYLTEINWLNEKSFFLNHRKEAGILIALTALTILTTVGFMKNAYGSIVLFCLVAAIGLVFSHRRWLTWLVGALLAVSLYFAAHYGWLVGLFLPSLVHVYLFTWLFILYGAIRTQNKVAFVEASVLMLMPLFIAFMPLNTASYSWNNETLEIFRQSNFQQLSAVIGKIFGAEGAHHPEHFLLSEAGIRIQIFIAFAYLYHYLNWFSKVSIIGWLKQASTGRILFILALWLLSISLYAYHYAWGLTALFLLSLLHVTLEFPLNIISAKEIFNAIRKHF